MRISTKVVRICEPLAMCGSIYCVHLGRFDVATLFVNCAILFHLQARA